VGTGVTNSPAPFVGMMHTAVKARRAECDRGSPKCAAGWRIALRVSALQGKLTGDGSGCVRSESDANRDRFGGLRLYGLRTNRGAELRRRFGHFGRGQGAGSSTRGDVLVTALSLLNVVLP